jgi:hypothetical protein
VVETVIFAGVPLTVKPPAKVMYDCASVAVDVGFITIRIGSVEEANWLTSIRFSLTDASVSSAACV